MKIFRGLSFLFLLLQCSLFVQAQPRNTGIKTKKILFETNSGYQDLTYTNKTVFARYVLPEKITAGQFYENRRMITEEFMAGINFANESAVLTIKQFWNG